MGFVLGVLFVWSLFVLCLQLKKEENWSTEKENTG